MLFDMVTVSPHNEVVKLNHQCLFTSNNINMKSHYSLSLKRPRSLRFRIAAATSLLGYAAHKPLTSTTSCGRLGNKFQAEPVNL
jgi:hypothetical protein